MLTDQSQYIKIELLNNQWIKLFMLINHSQLSELSKDQSKESFNSSETFQLRNWLTDPSLLKKSSMLINQCIKIRLLRRLLKSQSFKRKLLRRLLKDQCHLFKRSLLRSLLIDQSQFIRKSSCMQLLEELNKEKALDKVNNHKSDPLRSKRELLMLLKVPRRLFPRIW